MYISISINQKKLYSTQLIRVGLMYNKNHYSILNFGVYPKNKNVNGKNSLI